MVPPKERLQVGSDADVLFVNLNEERTVRWQDVGFQSDFSVYEGMHLKGWPVVNVKAGKVAYQDGGVLVESGSGGYLRHWTIVIPRRNQYATLLRMEARNI